MEELPCARPSKKYFPGIILYHFLNEPERWDEQGPSLGANIRGLLCISQLPLQRIWGPQTSLQPVDVMDVTPGLTPQNRSQQMFSAKGQVVIFQALQALWSLTQLFNTATIEQKQLQTISNQMGVPLPIKFYLQNIWVSLLVSSFRFLLQQEILHY